MTGFSPNIDYIIKVRAYRTVGTKKYYGAFSENKTIKTISISQVKNVKYSSSEIGKITSTWDKVANATGYEIYIYRGKEKGFQYCTSSTTNSKLMKGFSPNVSYIIKVRAYKAVGTKKYYGAFSANTIIKTTNILGKVMNLSIYNNKSTNVSLRWKSVSRADGYVIEKYNYNTNKWDICKTVTSTSTTISKSSSDINFKFRVRAYAVIRNVKYYGAYSDIYETKLGIDVSQFNNAINWQTVKNAGIQYVIIRAGGRFFGSTNGRIYVDDNFKANITQAVKYGFKIGVYFYTAAINTTEAWDEANFCINSLKDYGVADKVQYIAYDFESYDEGRMKDLRRRCLE